MKIQKKKIFERGVGWGEGGLGGGDVYKEWKLCEKAKNRGGGQGRCERKSEAFVKIQ